jgi:hypothetical protein
MSKKPLSTKTSASLKAMYESDLEQLRQARAKEMDEWSNAILNEKFSRKGKLTAALAVSKIDTSDQSE